MDKTINVISTPNIEGNIGSCETKSVDTPIHNGVFVSEHQIILTNSCTGKVINQYTYTDTTGYFLVPTITIIVTFCILWFIKLFTD